MSETDARPGAVMVDLLRERDAEIARLKAEVERLEYNRNVGTGTATYWAKAAYRLAKWRDMCLDGLDTLLDDLADRERYINKLEMERDAAQEAARMAEERMARLVGGK